MNSQQFLRVPFTALERLLIMKIASAPILYVFYLLTSVEGTTILDKLSSSMATSDLPLPIDFQRITSGLRGTSPETKPLSSLSASRSSAASGRKLAATSSSLKSFASDADRSVLVFLEADSEMEALFISFDFVESRNTYVKKEQELRLVTSFPITSVGIILSNDNDEVILSLNGSTQKYVCTYNRKKTSSLWEKYGDCETVIV